MFRVDSEEIHPTTMPILSIVAERLRKDPQLRLLIVARYSSEQERARETRQVSARQFARRRATTVVNILTEMELSSAVMTIEVLLHEGASIQAPTQVIELGYCRPSP